MNQSKQDRQPYNSLETDSVFRMMFVFYIQSVFQIRNDVIIWVKYWWATDIYSWEFRFIYFAEAMHLYSEEEISLKLQ